MNPRLSRGSLSGRSSEWLLLPLLVAGVLIPASCVLWFMGEAARSQAEAARRNVADAYRGQLLLLAERLDADWRRRAAELNTLAASGTPAAFQQAVAAGLADSIVLLAPDGHPAYPAGWLPLESDPLEANQEWLRAQTLERGSHAAEAAAAYASLANSTLRPATVARAFQAQVRCLLHDRKKEEALRVIFQHFTPASSGVDLHRRLIAADEQLLALQLLGQNDPRFRPALQRLTAVVNDYRGSTMPSAQRLFLMNELVALAPDFDAQLITHKAEFMAAHFLNAERVQPGDTSLQRSRAAGLWKLTAANSRAVALYRTETIARAAQQILNPQGSRQAVLFSLDPPGARPSPDSLSAGALLPGWQISFAPGRQTSPNSEAAGRMASYLWAGYLTIAGIVLTGLVVGHALVRQWRVTRLKTDLVAAVSHELKTPLASMRLLVDSLREDGHSDRERVADYLGLISAENARLTRLIDNLLTFSRIERRRSAFEFAPTDSARVIAAAIDAMGERLQPSACRFAANIEADLPAIHGDEDALVSVLVNLLDNACKYSPGEKRVELSARRNGGQVVFEVKDHGIGIAARDRKRIFRRFYQVDRRLSRETGGCGLGLSIVAFIVRAHGGTVQVASQQGQGSTFSVALPKAVLR